MSLWWQWSRDTC